MRVAQNAPRGPFYVLDRLHGLAEILERGAGVKEEHNAQNHSNFGFGWHPMNLRVGHQENVSQFSGDVRRQHFSLFASDKTEKHAWHTTLNTVTNSSREWAYVGHEIKDSCAYITGKKK